MPVIEQINKQTNKTNVPTHKHRIMSAYQGRGKHFQNSFHATNALSDAIIFIYLFILTTGVYQQ